jgi:hypothetical protein
MFKIGCSRSTVFWLQAVELVIVVAMGVGTAAVLSVVVVLAAPHLLRWM